MRTVKVKICGVTNPADTLRAVQLGADFLGLNFYPPSARFLSLETAVTLGAMIPAPTERVGLFVNSDVQTIMDHVEACGLHWVQCHGDESPEFCRLLAAEGIRVIKAFRVRGPDDVERARAYPVQAFLFDAFDPNQYGGTGRIFDWSLVRRMDRPVFLAGGITPDNVARAACTGVYAVDVCSGVESTPGQKDHVRMQQLFDALESQ